MHDRAVLVTGAGGFIGGEVARLLAGQPGMIVRGATRDGRLVGEHVAPCRLDVRRSASVEAALDGTSAVVHCAVGGRATTVDGMRTLLRAALKRGVRRIVHLSSIAVYGAATGAVGEATPPVSAAGRGYAHWKAAAEELCADAAHAGVETVVLRPAIVYGPGSTQWITRPARRLLSGGWGGLGELGQGTCNPVHVRDVAAACLAALRAPRMAPGEAFNLSGPATLSWNEWHARLATALGCPPLREISPAAWRRRMLLALPPRAVARLLPAAGRWFERPLLAAPAPSELALFALTASYPNDKAAAGLGWRPAVGLAEGVADSIAWLRAAGIAP